MSIRKHVSILASIICLCLTPGCTRSTTRDAEGIITFMIGDTRLIRAGTPTRKINTGERVLAGDTLSTGDRSIVAIQFGENCLMRLEQNATLRIQALSGDNLELFLKSGISLGKLVKTDDFSCILKTLTTLAAIRGTTFSILYVNGISEVAVSEGAVVVSPVAHNADGTMLARFGKEITVKQGSAAVITRSARKKEEIVSPLKLTIRPLSMKDAIEFGKIKTMPIIPELEKKSIREIEKIQENTIEKENEMDKNKGAGADQDAVRSLIANKNRTLNDIRQVYNGIDEVTLLNGSVINGAIISRGDVYRIITPGGIISVPKNEIKNMIKK